MSPDYSSKETHQQEDARSVISSFFRAVFSPIFRIGIYPLLLVQLINSWVWELNFNVYHVLLPGIVQEVTERFNHLFFGSHDREFAAQLEDLNLTYDEGETQFPRFQYDATYGSISPKHFERQLFNPSSPNTILERIQKFLFLNQMRFKENRIWLEENAENAYEMLRTNVDERIKELTGLREKSDYVFDRYVMHSPFCVINKLNSAGEKMVYTYKGQKLSKGEGFSVFKKRQIEKDIHDSSLKPLRLVRRPYSNNTLSHESTPSHSSYSTLSSKINESYFIDPPPFAEQAEPAIVFPLQPINEKWLESIAKESEREPVSRADKMEKTIITPSEKALLNKVDNNGQKIEKVELKKIQKGLNFIINDKQTNTFKIKYTRKNSKVGNDSKSKLHAVPTMIKAEPDIPTVEILAVSKQALSVPNTKSNKEIDYESIRDAIKKSFLKPEYDDGSLAPIILRLAWHCSATYDKETNTGGSNGATMRFLPEITDEGNTGLEVARMALEEIKFKFPYISYSDLWTLAGVCAIEAMGGPKVPWSSGRLDCIESSRVPPNGRLPLGYKDSFHIRNIFRRMGFNEQETVALCGAHALGRCHKKYSGWDGAWTKDPITFSNEFFYVLVNEKWEKGTVPETGREQYYNEDKSLMMLNTDMELIKDPEFSPWVEKYAIDQEAFFNDFSDVFAKLIELGISRDESGKVILK